MTTFFEKLQKDEVVIQYRGIARTVDKTFDPEKIAKEARYLHRERKSRKLHELRVSPEKVQAAVMNDLSNRARLIELWQLLHDQLDLLDSALRMVKNHVRAAYPAALAANAGTTKDAQLVFLDSYFKKGVGLLGRIKAAQQSLDVYIKDLDQAGRSMYTATEILKLTLANRSSVV